MSGIRGRGIGIAACESSGSECSGHVLFLPLCGESAEPDSNCGRRQGRVKERQKAEGKIEKGENAAVEGRGRVSDSTAECRNANEFPKRQRSARKSDPAPSVR